MLKKKKTNCKMFDLIFVVKHVQVTRKQFHKQTKLIHFWLHRFLHYSQCVESRCWR